MHAKLHVSRIALVAGILSTAFALGVGPLASDAEANRRHKSGRGHNSHHRQTVVVRESCYPQQVVVRRHAAPVRYVRPWYNDAPRVVVASSPYYFHAGLNLYLGGVNLNFAFTDPAPYGYAYMDPYCGDYFYSVSEYRQHLCHVGHESALRVVFVG